MIPALERFRSAFLEKLDYDPRWSKFELHELHIFAAALSEFGPYDPTDPTLTDLAAEVDDELTRRQR